MKKSGAGGLASFAEGILFAMLPLPALLVFPFLHSTALLRFPLCLCALSATGLLCAALRFSIRTPAGRRTASGAVFFTFLCAGPYLPDSPGLALAVFLAASGAWFALSEFPRGTLSAPDRRTAVHARECGGALTVLLLLAITPFCSHGGAFSRAVPPVCALGLLILYLWNTAHLPPDQPRFLRRSAGILGLLLIAGGLLTDQAAAAAFFAVLPLLPLRAFTRFAGKEENQADWAFLLNHPARILILSFLFLCFAGTVLLSLPVSQARPFPVLSAAFTSVSAVCVTGLTVIDPALDLTILGRIFLLLLIQCGGLGIMSITAVALYAAGKRLSLRQEHLMCAITDTDGSGLKASLLLIFRYTFFLEGICAILLAFGIHLGGTPFLPALGEGVFTSVSAFCNAGFALRSSNMVFFKDNPLVLYTVSALIISGGIAPAVSLTIPNLFRRKRLPEAADLVLRTTAFLLLSGFLSMLAFEWHGVLSGMSVPEKINNAFFQSVTLRTAGFNSVDIGLISPRTWLAMTMLMFIGGSPGGTAGGIRTTVFAVLVLTFRSCLKQTEPLYQGRRISSSTIAKAVTITAGYAFVLALSVLALLSTQSIGFRETVFEAVSALGTVGLTMNATSRLDEVGRVIVMLTMFAGRVGPVTLFMLLSADRGAGRAEYPEAKIPLT